MNFLQRTSFVQDKKNHMSTTFKSVSEAIPTEVGSKRGLAKADPLPYMGSKLPPGCQARNPVFSNSQLYL